MQSFPQSLRGESYEEVAGTQGCKKIVTVVPVVLRKGGPHFSSSLHGFSNFSNDRVFTFVVCRANVVQSLVLWFSSVFAQKVLQAS